MAKRKMIATNEFAYCPLSDDNQFPITIPGQAMTPSDIKSLADRGIAVSTQMSNTTSAEIIDEGFFVDPIYRRDSDANTLWNLERTTRARFAEAQRKDKYRYG